MAGKEFELEYQLPEAEELTKRIAEIPHLDNYSKSKLTPHLVKRAGTILVPMGLLLFITQAVADVCEGMPPVTRFLLEKYTLQIAKAIVGDDNEEFTQLCEMGWDKVQEKQQGGGK